MLDHSSAWNKHPGSNKHHGVGATLLDNWVEERAVADKIIKERSNIITLSKFGHQHLLSMTNKHEIKTNHKEEFKKPVIPCLPMGKRTLLRQQELVDKAKDLAPEDLEKCDYKTTAGDIGFGMPPAPILGSVKPEKELLEKFDRPITFWSKNNPVLKKTHLKDTRFSIPIEHNLHSQRN